MTPVGRTSAAAAQAVGVIHKFDGDEVWGRRRVGTVM